MLAAPLGFRATSLPSLSFYYIGMFFNLLLPTSVGLLGELLARTYFESQGKPAYTVRATLNLEPIEDRRAA